MLAIRECARKSATVCAGKTYMDERTQRDVARNAWQDSSGPPSTPNDSKGQGVLEMRWEMRWKARRGLDMARSRPRAGTSTIRA